MIGTDYWSPGITLEPIFHDGKLEWKLKLEFLDAGWCDEDSTEGVLTTRYYCTDLSRAIQVLIQDAEKLGIELRNPHLYMRGDGEHSDIKYPHDWKEIMRSESERLGWKCIY